MATKARKYLNARGFSDFQIDAYDLRYETTGRDGGRIVIPFKENGEIVYYQARSFMKHERLKILNPEQDEGKSRFLFNFDQARDYTQVIICEGWASAMSAGPNAVAQSGIKPSERQLELLVSNWDDFVVMLDAGTVEESWWLAKALLHRKPKARVVITSLKAGDPNDHTFIELQQIIADAVTADFQTEMRARL
jgi:DNA primase